jgi:hypothetical protein
MIDPNIFGRHRLNGEQLNSLREFTKAGDQYQQLSINLAFATVLKLVLLTLIKHSADSVPS